jgi:hypothetical protein
MQTITTVSLSQISGGISTSTLIQRGIQSATITMSLELLAATHPQYGRGAAAIGTLYVISSSISNSCADLLELTTSAFSTKK